MKTVADGGEGETNKDELWVYFLGRQPLLKAQSHLRFLGVRRHAQAGASCLRPTSLCAENSGQGPGGQLARVVLAAWGMVEAQ
eukprot:CAMPEP_0171962722 /NCGR_PEP_ID=MMETSP0993-20121228/171189_1 /TAXON_ID=483369 /ORGANISM="non described non described, Strain CCMP2098" /LENGTH=82 /DNA_ID=CAMNT_0012611133 /DNA_START=18 /DNA_END=264 /DNA_ORIENTATION=+